MAGFIRRYGYTPGVETITLIEGVIILDLPPPAQVSGVSSGTVGLVGEFPDMTYATAVSSTGVVTTYAQPVEIVSGRDLTDKLGGWDETLGHFGRYLGNGFATLRNKKFTRLVCVPVNLASGGAGRVFRELPTNLSATQAVPVVPMSGGRVEAGREFRATANRVRLAKRVDFTALGHYKNAIDGSTTTAGAAATQVLTSAGGGFLTAYNGGPVPKGAIVVLGQIGGAGALGTNAGTYRVAVQASVDTTLTLEKLDGTNFVLTTGTNQPFRIHPQSDADSGGLVNSKAYALADTGGYGLPCRPLDATIAAATNCSPTVVPPANAASSWDALSGLKLQSHPSAGFVYTATIQAPNATNDATIDALYLTAIDALKQDQAPARDVNIVVASRKSDNIRTALKTHALQASEVGLGRVACISPDLYVVNAAAAQADAAPGVGATRDERVLYSWPGAQTYMPEAVGFTLGTADGNSTTDGILDTSGDAWLASVLSNLPPERNPGEAGEPVSTVLSPVIGLQRGVAALTMQDYVNMRRTGICGLRMDKAVGPVFQSGVTSSLTSGKKNINRRRMADFIQDSVAQGLVKFAKKPATQAWKDSIVGEIDAFLNTLKSPNNAAAQRINDYAIDDKSGNTPDLEAAGIFVVIGRVRLTPTGDFIVFQSEVGENVVVTQGA